jgi:beta-lactamase superfamily II metal-dependent hydrolase
MTFTVFDVGQGFCAYLIADNANVILFDCGQNSDTGFRPSQYLPTHGCNAIEELIITNFDQDHVSDLPDLLANLSVQVFRRNRSISPEQLRALKLDSGPITAAMESAIDLHERYVEPVQNPPGFGILEVQCFCNNYPSFEDTNNLSLVTFLEYDGFTILLPGDLEKPGWLALLQNRAFNQKLSEVAIFIASHHGRHSGYCPEVFEHCQPEIVIVSDKEIMHDTQKSLYGKHAKGVPWEGGTTRYVLTTRSDGNIRITRKPGERAHITTGVS